MIQFVFRGNRGHVDPWLPGPIRAVLFGENFRQLAGDIALLLLSLRCDV